MTDFDAQRKAIESILKSVLGNSQYCYLSGPITGGPRFFEWYTSVGRFYEADQKNYVMLLKRQVIDRNIEELQLLAGRLREDHGLKIIEPGSFEAPNQIWGQQEFYRFWESVITQHAEKVYFKSGWNLSVGCLYEYFIAVRTERGTYFEDGTELTGESACRIIQDGLDKYRDNNEQKIIEQLTRLEGMMNAIKFEI